jgi:hypothetical protein
MGENILTLHKSRVGCQDYALKLAPKHRVCLCIRQGPGNLQQPVFNLL